MTRTQTQPHDARDLVIVIMLIAIVLAVLMIITQVHLDDEPYPCTVTERVLDT